MKINEIIILIIFSIIISSCTAIPKPNPDKPDSILIVPVSVTNKSKHPISQQFQFTFSNKDDGSEVFHTYLPKVDNSYLIIKNLKPGNYQFLRVHNTKNSKFKKEPSNSTFKMEDDTITIIQDQFVYKQTVRGGDWYTYNFNTSYLNKGGYNKLIEKLEENENFKSWKIRCKWCNKSDTSSPVMRPVGYTSSNASATSNVFVLKGVTSEFWAGDIVTFGDSKKEYEILEAGVLCFSNLKPCPIVRYYGGEFKISPGSGNIHGIVIKGAVGFEISPGIKVSVVGGGSSPPPPSDTSSPVVKVSGYTSHSAPATSNVFVLKEVTTNIYWDCINREGNDGKTYEESIAACTGITEEFSKGDIVTFGHSKEGYEIIEAKVLKKSESGKIQDGYIYMEKEWAIRVLYKGTEFKITQRPFSLILSGDGNIQGIVLKKAVGFIISPGMRVSAVR